MELAGASLVVALIVVFILGAVAGLFISRFTMKKYFEKNPPITEEMLASIMQGMGQTPNKKKINQIMKKMKQK